MPDGYLGPDKWHDDVITAVVCDDFALARRRLIVMLEEQDDIDVAAEAVDGDQCIALCRELGPDVVVCGMTVERIGGPATAAGVREAVPSAHVVMLVTGADEHQALDAVLAGATGFVSREVLEAAPTIVRAAAAGTVALPPPVARAVLDAYAAPQETGPAARLADREATVLGTLARGGTYTDAAAELGCPDTVAKVLVANAVEKLSRQHRVAGVLASARGRAG